MFRVISLKPGKTRRIAGAVDRVKEGLGLHKDVHYSEHEQDWVIPRAYLHGERLAYKTVNLESIRRTGEEKALLDLARNFDKEAGKARRNGVNVSEDLLTPFGEAAGTLFEIDYRLTPRMQRMQHTLETSSETRPGQDAALKAAIADTARQLQVKEDEYRQLKTHCSQAGQTVAQTHVKTEPIQPVGADQGKPTMHMQGIDKLKVMRKHLGWRS